MKTEVGSIGSIIASNEADELLNKTPKLYKDKRYIIWAKGCFMSAHLGPLVHKMNEFYKNANPNNETSYGMADIEYESTYEFIFPCLKLKGTPLIKTKRNDADFIPVELNYL